MDRAMIVLENNVAIPDSCLELVFSRSSGPGGQNVNKVSTRVTVIFDLAGCETLSEEQKQRIRQAARQSLDKNGRIHISSQQYRSQWSNRVAALEKLRALLEKALKPKKKRKKTRTPAGAIDRRLEMKKRRSRIKKLRSELFH
jgi:ribosome-associated protein